jgi:hypothetical protein
MMAGGITVGGAPGSGGQPSGGADIPLLPFVLIALVAGGYAAYRLTGKGRAGAPALQPAATASSTRSPSGKRGTQAAAQARSHTGSVKGVPTPSHGRREPAPAALWGFQPAEVVVGLSLVAGAVLAGLAFGGFFH